MRYDATYELYSGKDVPVSGIILGMDTVKYIWCYDVTSSLID